MKHVEPIHAFDKTDHRWKPPVSNATNKVRQSLWRLDVVGILI